MGDSVTRRKISIYMNDGELRRRAKMAAARREISLSQFCAEAVEEKLNREEGGDVTAAALRAARRMDERRAQIGPLGLRTPDLVDEGRRR